MNDFIPLLDMLENEDYDSQRKLKGEMSELEHKIRLTMDAGLVPAEMEVTHKIYAAAQSANLLLEKLSA